MTDLLDALKYTDEVISGEQSPIESVEITYEEAGENCTFYIVTTHVAPMPRWLTPATAWRLSFGRTAQS